MMNGTLNILAKTNISVFLSDKTAQASVNINIF